LRVPPDRISEVICFQVARLLKLEREQRGFSLNMVAQKAGLSWHAVRFVENGLRNPTLDTLVRISLALEVDLETIIGRARKLALTEAPAKVRRLPHT
jgi:transcriptional regulator with XRE-family HTH domain